MDSPEKPTVYSTTRIPTGFYIQKLWSSVFLMLEPLAVESDLGLGSLVPKISLLTFIHPT